MEAVVVQETWDHLYYTYDLPRIQWRTGGGGFKPPPPEIPKALQIVPNSTRARKLLKIAEFKTTPQDVRKKGSKILKLPSVRNCFTLAMTNKLVVIIHSVKVPKIKNLFSIWNEISCTKLQLPPELVTKGATAPRSPFTLSSVLNWICWTPPRPWTKFLGSPLRGYIIGCRRSLRWAEAFNYWNYEVHDTVWCGPFNYKFRQFRLIDPFSTLLFHHYCVLVSCRWPCLQSGISTGRIW